jgi:glycosyltransferase involved in cell wall biosynthesis
MDTARFDLHLAALQPGGMRMQDLPSYVNVHELGISRVRWIPYPIAKLCWKVRPDIVFSMSAHLNSMIVASRSLLPAGTRLFVREGSDITLRASRPKLLIYKQAYKRADVVICQTEHMKRDLVRQFGLQPEKVIHIYNPVDVEEINALADAEPNPFAQSGTNIVAVGRLSHEKGFDLLLACLQSVRAMVSKLSVTIVGDGPELSVLNATKWKLSLESMVNFVGPRRNPFPFIKHADLVVLPSRSEALPNVVLEAIALGTPVVTTNCTDALGEISGCTKWLRIAPDRTSEALAKEIISALVARPVNRKREVELQFAARFGVRAAVQQFESLFLYRGEESLASVSRQVDLAA